jgi:hypothetical protein
MLPIVLNVTTKINESTNTINIPELQKFYAVIDAQLSESQPRNMIVLCMISHDINVPFCTIFGESGEKIQYAL